MIVVLCYIKRCTHCGKGVVVSTRPCKIRQDRLPWAPQDLLGHTGLGRLGHIFSQFSWGMGLGLTDICVSMAVVQHKDKDQAAGLQLAEPIILCGHQAFRMHLKSTAVSVHDDDKSEVARQNSRIVGVLCTWQDWSLGCHSCRWKPQWSCGRSYDSWGLPSAWTGGRWHTPGWKAITRADNPYSRIAILGRGRLAIKSGRVPYVTRCTPTEVVSRSHTNCTEEVPVFTDK
jgi:hypothetical protein